MSEEWNCEDNWHEWFAYGGIDIHSIDYHDGKFEALVNVIVKCKYCEETHELCMSAEDEVEL